MRQPSRDAQAIALACSGLVPSTPGGPKPLSPTEWHEVSLSLRRAKMRPGDLLDLHGSQVHESLDLPATTSERLNALLSRGGQLAFELERLSSRGIWLLTRADDDYPQVFKDRLRATSPPLFYCSGGRGLLSTEGLGIVGSRDVDPDGLAFASALGAACAEQWISVISGAARGVDLTAMSGALDAGGTAVGLVSEPLERMVRRKDLRRALGDETLLLMSPWHPAARWQASNAMRRNRLIYTLSRAAVVVATASGSGGTWAGAVENLKHNWVPLFVRDDGTDGSRALTGRGGNRLPDGPPPADIRSLFLLSQPSLLDVDETPAPVPAADYAQAATSKAHAGSYDSPAPEEPAVVPPSSGLNGRAPAELFFAVVWEALSPFLSTPRKPEEIAEVFDVSNAQLRVWLTKAVDEGLAEKRNRPVRYVAVGRQAD